MNVNERRTWHKYKPVKFTQATDGELLKISIGLTDDLAVRVKRYAMKKDIAFGRAIRELLAEHPQLK